MRVFVDSNIVMYAAGAPHAHKQPSLAFLRRVQSGEIQAVTSVEVLQEVLHRYRRLGEPLVADQVYALLVQLCAEVLPVTIADTDLCVQLLGERGGSVRDALHVAVMLHADLDLVATYDTAFERFGVRRWPL